MKSKKNFAPWLIIVGAFLILVNTLYVVGSGQPIILSSFYVGSVDQIQSLTSVWGRMAFGFPGIAEGWAAIIWIFLAVFNFLLSFLLLVKTGKNMSLKYIGLILSLLSIAVGGGFILGLVLCFFGYLVVLQPGLPFEETFIGKIYGVAKLDSSFLSRIAEEKTALHTGALVLVFVNLLSGIGSGLYSYNLEIIRANLDTISSSSSQAILFEIFFMGGVHWGLPLVAMVFLQMGLAIIKWAIFSLIIYVLGAKMVGSSARYEDIAKIVAFAYVPVCLQIFMPAVLVWPWLFFEWPFIVILVTNFWFFVILMTGLKIVLDISAGRAFGVSVFCSSIYWFFNSVVLSSFLNFPGIRFSIQPIDVSVLIVSTSALVAVMLGVFKRYVSV